MGLTRISLADAVLAEIKAMSNDGTWSLQCGVLMPDHLHLLIALGERLTLAKAVQRLKARTSAILCAAEIEWERGFFDRQLRPRDDRLAVYQYIYLNPYRADLLPVSGRWPHYFCREQDWRWFRDLLNTDLPYPEWLR